MLRELRKIAPDVELRLDANGAFRPEEALERLELLAPFRIHSIEQPIRQGQWPAMARLCRKSPIPIALDEELIGLTTPEKRRKMISTIRPHYIILKPSLVGGGTVCRDWLDLADEFGAGSWFTSALESNIGLNSIAQFAARFGSEMPQGLGTGELYTNNIPSPITRRGDQLWYDPNGSWEIPEFNWQ